jgi:hypothetical protein
MRRHKQPPRSTSGGQPAAPRAASADAGAPDVDVDDDDIAFIQSHRRQLGFLSRAVLEEAPCAPACMLFRCRARRGDS